MKDGKFYIENIQISVHGDDILVRNEKNQMTDGVWKVLTLRNTSDGYLI